MGLHVVPDPDSLPPLGTADVQALVRGKFLAARRAYAGVLIALGERDLVRLFEPSALDVVQMRAALDAARRLADAAMRHADAWEGALSAVDRWEDEDG